MAEEVVTTKNESSKGARYEWIKRGRALQKEFRANIVDETFFINYGLAKEMTSENNLASSSRRVLKIKEGLKYVQSLIKSGKNSDVIREAIVQFEQRLEGLKAALSSDYELALAEERSIGKDISEFSIDLYDTTDPAAAVDDSKQAAQSTRIAETFEKSLAVQAQVGAIDRQIAHLGGRCGNWDSRDHDLFLRGVAKSVGSDLSKLRPERPMVARLLEMLPSKSDEDVKEHIAWYIKYDQLQQEKKSIVDAWKGERVRRASSATSAKVLALQEAGDSAEGDTVDEIERRAEQKEKLRRWKEERESQRLLEEEEKRRLQSHEELKRQEQKHQEQLRQKRLIQAWKDKAEEDAVRMQPSVAKVERPLEKKVIDRNHERNLELIQGRTQKVEALKQQSARREKLLLAESRANLAERDPMRLLKSTKAFESNKVNVADLDDAVRRRAVSGAHGANIAMGGYDLKYKGRAKTWFSSM